MSNSASCDLKEVKESDVNKTSSKTRKKEVRNVEALLKSMSNLNTEEKLQVLITKHTELLEESRTNASTVKALERQLLVVQREKEQVQAENGKSLLARSRLEDLCRELQRQNKAIKDESMVRVREEEERRKQISTKFQTTLSDVSALLQQNTDRNQKLKDENNDMAAKLQMLCDQYTVREQNLEKLAKQYDIERQLNEANLAKVRMEAAEGREKMLIDKQQLLVELTEYQKKCQAMQLEEVGLREQLAMYTEKYNEFQKALKASNQQFFGFKTQMDGMTKKLKNLEKETASWKQRWEKSNNLLIDMAAEKKQRDAEILNNSKQIAQLEKLCRALQTERAALLSQLKTSSNSSQTPVDTSGNQAVQKACASTEDASCRQQITDLTDSVSDLVSSINANAIISEPVVQTEVVPRDSTNATTSTQSPTILNNSDSHLISPTPSDALNLLVDPGTEAVYQSSENHKD